MNGQLFFYLAPLIFAAATSLALSIYTVMQRAGAVANYFALTMAAVTGWSVAAILMHISDTLVSKLLWNNVQYFGITLIPLSWLAFVLAYTGRRGRLTRRMLGSLSIHPVVTLFFVWANPNGLFRADAWLSNSKILPAYGDVMGPAFWVHTLYSYVVLSAGSYLLVRDHLHAPRLYRRQVLLLMVAVTAPWAANVVSLLRPRWLDLLDLTPFAFALSGLAIGWGLLRHRLMDLMPVARAAVMENLSSGVVILDRNDRVVDINPVAADLVGADRSDILGQRLSEAWPQIGEVIDRIRDVDGAHEIGAASDPVSEAYEVRSSSLRDRRGHLIGRLVAVQDVTDYKQTEAALSRYAQRLRILHEIDRAILAAKSSETIALAALDQIHHVLPGVRMSVVERDGLGRARLLASRVHGKLQARDAAIWERVLGMDDVWPHEIQSVQMAPMGALGGTVSPPAEDISRQLLDEGIRSFVMVPLMVQETVLGSLILEDTAPDAFTTEHMDMAAQIADSLSVALQNARLYAAAQQELTERKQAEAALRSSETTLREKADDLAARNAELDAFAHTVAHDLKAPLSLMIGYATFLDGAEAIDDASFNIAVQAIEESARKMGDIIDELLLLASVRKRDEIELNPLDMDVIVSDVLQRLSEMVERHDAEITLPEVWPIALGHGPWIEEVWANYISNAIKYGGDPLKIALGATVVDNNGGPRRVRFWVRDNGSGLSPQQQARLFIPFERLDQIRAKGHGLGLSIVQRIMEKLGGEAGVESSGTPGEGSLFYFTLPEADI